MSLLCDIYYTCMQPASIFLRGPHIKEVHHIFSVYLCVAHVTDLIYSDHAWGSVWPAINNFLVIGCLYRTRSISSHSVHCWPVSEWSTTEGQFGLCFLCNSGFLKLQQKKLDDFLNKGFKDILYLWMHHLVHTVCGDWLIIKCTLRFLSWFHQDLHLFIWNSWVIFLCWIGDLTLSFLFCCILFLDKVDTVTSDWFSWPVFFPSHDYITLIT